MGMRERIASRMSRLAQRGVETPILNEVAVPAEVLSVSGFSAPTLDAFKPEALGDLVKSFQALPSFAHGKAVGATAGQWYRVRYPKAMTGAVPVIVGLGRLGSITNRVIERVERHDFNNDFYCDKVAAGARDRAKTLSPPWPLDGLWGWFCDTFVYAAFFAGWAMGGWVLNVLWDSFLQPQIDRVQDAVNLRLEDLYNTWGLPTNVVPTPLHVRNVTSSGFEFQSYGNTTVYWIAVGQ